MNTTIWTGLTLTILGVGGLTATEATLTAATVAVLGLALIGLGTLMRQEGREEVAGAVAGLHPIYRLSRRSRESSLRDWSGLYYCGR